MNGQVVDQTADGQSGLGDEIGGTGHGELLPLHGRSGGNLADVLAPLPGMGGGRGGEQGVARGLPAHPGEGPLPDSGRLVVDGHAASTQLPDPAVLGPGPTKGPHGR